MEKLTWVLWQEREFLETLLYRLEVEEMVMSSGRTRWLANAARDVEDVTASLRQVEVMRAVAADEAAVAVGLDPDPSLSDLASAAEEPWRSILVDHRDAFVALTGEIGRVAATNRSLIAAGLRATHETLLGVSDPGATTYTAAGSVRRSAASAAVDWSL